jgi:hypothetical protein
MCKDTIVLFLTTKYPLFRANEKTGITPNEAKRLGGDIYNIDRFLELMIDVFYNVEELSPAIGNVFTMLKKSKKKNLIIYCIESSGHSTGIRNFRYGTFGVGRFY